VVPLSLLDQSWLAGKKIIMLEPRRPAARMAAHRMAWLLGQKTGHTVGYQVRFERQVSQQTRIEVLTEGLLLKRIQSDPELSDVGLIIFDEFHERSLVADLSLALSIDICNGLRDDLRLLVMSATLDTGRLEQLLNAKTITANGNLHPVTIHHARQDLPLNDVVEACLPLIEQALEVVQQDVLVFLPGRKEIDRIQVLAQEKWRSSCEIFTLYGDLSSEKQDQVLNPANKKQRRLILATDIAETSLTIEGVEAVVDSGRARKPLFQASNGLTRLQLQWISKASAAQRTGRAGRLGPGHCYRAWTASFEQRLEDFTVPEILTADLASTVLEVAAWGVNDPQQLNWFDLPPAGHWQQASELLQGLGAIDSQGQISAQGREMSVLPVHPRLAHMLMQAQGQQGQQMVADIAALLTERDPLKRQPGNIPSVDLALRLTALSQWRHHQSNKGADVKALQRLDKLSKQFLRLLPANTTVQPDKALSAGAYLSMAYPDRIAKRRANGADYLMSSGRGVTLPEDDPMVNEQYLVIANLDAGKRDGRAWLAASIDDTEIEKLFEQQIHNQRMTFWDDQTQKVVARERRMLGQVILSDSAVALQRDDPVIGILLEQVNKQGLSMFAENSKLDSLRARIQTLRKLNTEGDWPDVSESGLLSSLDQWLVVWLDNVTSLKQLKQIDLVAVFESWLGWEKLQKLNELLPESYRTPAGTQRRIHYDFTEQPVLSVPLQEMLGVADSPVIAAGQLPLVVHLLSPAGRPLQVTADLAAFWQGAYQQVKKEMRERYPKHYWPDDPTKAEATRFTKRHLAKRK